MPRRCCGSRSRVPRCARGAPRHASRSPRRACWSWASAWRLASASACALALVAAKRAVRAAASSFAAALLGFARTLAVPWPARPGRNQAPSTLERRVSTREAAVAERSSASARASSAWGRRSSRPRSRLASSAARFEAASLPAASSRASATCLGGRCRPDSHGQGRVALGQAPRWQWPGASIPPPGPPGPAPRRLEPGGRRLTSSPRRWSVARASSACPRLRQGLLAGGEPGSWAASSSRSRWAWTLAKASPRGCPQRGQSSAPESDDDLARASLAFFSSAAAAWRCGLGGTEL